MNKILLTIPLFIFLFFSHAVYAADPTLTTNPPALNAGATSTVSWNGITNPTPMDWIGLYPSGAADDKFSKWIYVSCTQVAGSAQVDGSCDVAIPPSVQPGDYEFRLFANNGYTKLATSAPITVTPILPATLTTSPAKVNAGSASTVFWGNIVNATPMDWIGLFAAGAADGDYSKWIYVSCSQTAETAQAEGACAFTIPSSTAPGQYEFRLFANNGSTKLATSAPITVSLPATLSTSEASVIPGATSTVAWTNIASPMPMDWIGLFAAGAADNAYSKWVYVSCSQTPTNPQAAGSCSFTIPDSIAPGQYEFRLFANNGFTKLATSSLITVMPAIPAVLSVSPVPVNPGGISTVTWSDIANPAPMDWIGLFAAGAADANYFDWMYVSCSRIATASKASGSCAFTIPPATESGQYEFRLFSNNGSLKLATSAPVTITPNATYDIDGNLLTQTDALGHTTKYQYDLMNRVIKTTFADGSTVSYAYDAFGNQISITDQKGNTVTKTYDDYDRLSQIKDANGGITKFNYDSEGRLLTLTDANGHNTTYTYDPNGNVLTQANSLNHTTQYTYDPAGNVATKTDANGKILIYMYDAFNQLISTTYPDGTEVTAVYDKLGRKTSMTDSTGQTKYTYDDMGRLLTKKSPGTNNTITYTYDSEGNRLTNVDQDNRTITNTYDALNRLASVKDLNGTTTYGYDAVSNKVLVTSPNGVSENYTYDSLNRVLSVVNQGALGVIASFTNMYDPAGMIIKKIFQDGSWMQYTYDALNQLLEETKQTSTATIYDYVYTYDPVGNRMTWNYNGILRSYNYDAANRLSSWSFTANGTTQIDTYIYDNNGNRISKQVAITGQTSQQTSYSYDFENRLQVMSLPNASIGSPDTLEFIYNGEGLRTQVKTNDVASAFLYDDSNVLIERDDSGNTTKSYTRAVDYPGGISGLIAQNYISNSTPVVEYYHYDNLGSTSNLTTAAGATASSYSYDAFGNLTTAVLPTDANRYLFSTKEFDSRAGLYYFGARYYDPEVGRWLTQDPLEFVDGLNLYAYVNNNPVNFVDPDGYLGERIGSFLFDRQTFSDSYKLFNVADGDYGLQFLAIVGMGATIGDIGGLFVGGGGHAGKEGAEYLFKNVYKGTFDSKAGSLIYHLDKHGKGRTAVEYVKDAQRFYQKNKTSGKSVILKDGTPGIRVKGKQGGYWNDKGQVVSYWD